MKQGIFQPNKTKDITGLKYGSLTAVRFAYRDNSIIGGPHYWFFRCDCGKVIIARKNAVTSGNTTRCSDCTGKIKSANATTHGHSKSRLYKEWAGIIQRCTNPNSTSWNRYGGKGISICKEWKEFPLFMEWALAHGYNDSLTIDRIDSKGNYEPSNCRWVSTHEQANNKGNTLILEFEGKRQPLSYWAEELGINYHTLYGRIYKLKWPIEKAFTEGVK